MSQTRNCHGCMIGDPVVRGIHHRDGVPVYVCTALYDEDDEAPTPPSDAGPRERETGCSLTPELVAKLAAECDRVAEQWAPVAECIEEAKAALANCNPPHSPESDPSGLYFPLLFLVKRLEEYDNAE